MQKHAKPPIQPVEDEGLLFGCVLDGDGGAKPIGWTELECWSDTDSPLWVHLNLSEPRVLSWLAQSSGLSQVTSEALRAPESRPRVFHGKRGFVTILRGVNTNPGSAPEDMVALRIWSDGKRVITLRHEKLMTPLDILNRLFGEADGPSSAAELYQSLITRLTERIGVTVDTLGEDLDGIEARMETEGGTDLRREVSDMRIKLVSLRRYLAPQREALGSLLANPPEWFDDASRRRLREAADRTVLYIEEIDASREQSLVLKDEISNRLAEATNRTLYVLAIVSGVFLPFGFLTGLFGINIGGMPGTNSSSGFLIFCGVLLGLLIAELVAFKRLKWF